MERVTDISLRIALMAAAVGSLVMLISMVVELFVPLRWNWYNALAFFSATTLLAAARYLHASVRAAPEIVNLRNTFS
ncbi:MAG: hypothetical protein QOJ91_2299 [Sphingomonadales bacterium]|jgi:hypothetical protein|nr:hypothetical protein [Sphingomonadales bacterium]